MKPTIYEEKKLWKKGYQYVIGLDEVGRGPLAGPVVAACVSINPKFKYRDSKLKVNDSKKLTEKQREELYEILTNHPAILWGIGVVSEKVIDKINILEATKLSMKHAIDNLNSKLETLNSKQIPNSKYENQKHKIFLLIDGNFKIDTSIPQMSIIKGDAKVFSIATASIIAKVTRDRMMIQFHKKYPQYGFDQHKGYGTALHLKNLKNHGPCKIHRKTFWPVSRLD